MMRRWTSRLTALVLPLGFAVSAHAHPEPSRQLDRLQQQIADAPDDVELRLRRAQLERRRGHPRTACVDARVARRLAPESTAVRLEYARCLSTTGRRKAAESALNRLLTDAPRLADAWVERASLRDADGRLEAARADLDAAIDIRPSPHLVLERGRLDQRRGRLDDEADGYRRGLSSLGSAVVVELALVDVERRRGAPEQALRQLDALLARDGLRADWILLRADLLEQQGQAPAATVERLRALTEADAALRRRPTTLHHVTLARAFLALGAHASAADALEPALAQSPPLPAVQEVHALIKSAAEAP